MPDIGLFLLGVGSILVACFGVLLIPFSLPGNWLIAAVGLLGPALGLGWMPLAVLLGAAVLSEILELLLATRTTKKAGAGRAGQWGALVGGLFGAILGTPLLPIPILGTLLGSAMGAFFGAILFEIVFSRRGSQQLLGIGLGAFVGLLLGKGVKIAVGAFQVGYWTLAVFGIF